MKIYRGETVSSGVAFGRVWLRGYGAADGHAARIPSDQVEHELNRLRDALGRSRHQIEDVRARQEGKLAADELRIFDAHLAYLQDPLFIDEIEQQILRERLTVRGAITHLIANYDRIFALVESEHLRQRASDFRDVGMRVLRNLEEAEGLGAEAPRPEGPCILAAAKLTTTDIFDLGGGQIDGIVAEEGSISSHAAILARSMGIPAITGIADLPSKVEDGALVAIDARTAELYVEPDAETVQRCEKAAAQLRAERLQEPAEEREHRTRDGTEVRILGSCGSGGEVQLARSYGMDGIGVFRTELQFLSGRVPPGEDELVETYRAIVRQPAGLPVHVRLLDVSAAAPVVGVPASTERNPALGVRGIRWLLAHPEVLRLQVRAVLRAAAGTDGVAVLVPFVTGVSDLMPVKSAVLEERQSLRKQGVPCAERLGVAAVVEVPAAAFVLPTLLTHADFVVIALDGLLALLMAADRDTPGVRGYYEMVHPALFDLLNRMAREARSRRQRLVLFGEHAADPRLLPLFLGFGIRELSVAPVRMNGVLDVLRRYTIEECRGLAERVLAAPRALDVERILVQLARE